MRASLDKLCNDAFPAGAPGAAIGVIGRDKNGNAFRYANGFGLANLDAEIPFDAQTQFRACSISKQFVCLVMLQLAQEGKVDLDAHPSRYLPALKFFPPTLTLRHLSQNRSGLQDYWCAAMLTGADAESRFSLDDGVALIHRLTQPIFAPGAQYRYSNGNWRILEWVIAAVTGQTLPDVLAARIFRPLGMKDTSWGSDTSLALPGNPLGYRTNANGRWEVEITRACWSGDAALVTTLDDFLIWESAMLKPDPYILPGADALGDALPHPDGSRGSYAFGINAWERDGRSMLWHSGALRGWRMVHLRFPQDQTSIVVMMNRTENPTPFALKVAATVGTKTTWDDVVAESVSPSPPADRSGIYFSEKLGLLAEFRDDPLQAAATADLGGDTVALLRTAADQFATSSGFFRMSFVDGMLDIHARQYGWRDSFVRIAQQDDRLLLAGCVFSNGELNASLRFSADGATVFILGGHGQSTPYPVRPLAAGFVAFDCTRALDELPPGRFTVRIIGTEGAQIHVGCFMSGNFIYDVVRSPMAT